MSTQAVRARKSFAETRFGNLAAPDAARVVGDKYELIESLAEGGMGTVWRARHLVTGMEVALKVLRDDLGRDEANFERFLREVRFGASIGHTGIVRVFDAGEDESGSLYLAMELLRGESLDARLARTETTPLEALSWLRAALDPLEAAHSHGIVHRDLKPENLFIAQVGGGLEVLKIIDFGIARRVGVTGKTIDGSALGTVHYMSPEQASNARAVSPATDIWALGVMMYQAVTGQLPFDGESVHEVVLKLHNEPHTPALYLRPSIDSSLSELIDACLAKDPDKRPKNATDLAQRIDLLLEDPCIRADLSGERAESGPSVPLQSGERVCAPAKERAIGALEVEIDADPDVTQSSVPPFDFDGMEADLARRPHRLSAFVALGIGLTSLSAYAYEAGAGAALHQSWRALAAQFGPRTSVAPAGSTAPVFVAPRATDSGASARSSLPDTASINERLAALAVPTGTSSVVIASAEIGATRRVRPRGHFALTGGAQRLSIASSKSRNEGEPAASPLAIEESSTGTGVAFEAPALLPRTTEDANSASTAVETTPSIPAELRPQAAPSPSAPADEVRALPTPTPRLSTSVRLESLRVNGALPRREVARALHRATHLFASCFVQVAGTSEPPSSSIAVSLAIDGEGAFRNAHAEASPRSGAVEECLEREVNGLRSARRPDGGETRATFRVMFAAR